MALFTQDDINHGHLTYVSNGRRRHDANDSFGFTVQDVNGAPTAAQTFTITVHRSRNCDVARHHGPDRERWRTPPATVTSAAERVYSDNGEANGSSGATATIYTVTTLPTGGTLKLSGTPLALNGTFTQANINAGLVTYVNAGANSNDSFGFTVQDVSGTPTAAQTFTITVHDQGNVTLLANTGLTVNENATATVTSAELAYSDNGGAFNGVGATATIYTVTTLPTAGTLKLNGTPIALNGTFTQANINAGLVTYVNGGANSHDAFDFTVQDVSGSPTATQAFNITVNDPGIVTPLANTGLTVNENATATVTSGELAYSDDGGAFNRPRASETIFYTVDY